MTLTAIKRQDLNKTQGGGELCKHPGVNLKIGSFDPAFNRGSAFNWEITVMYKGLYGVCLLNLFASLGDLGTSSQCSPRLCGIQLVYHVLFINL